MWKWAWHVGTHIEARVYNTYFKMCVMFVFLRVSLYIFMYHIASQPILVSNDVTCNKD